MTVQVLHMGLMLLGPAILGATPWVVLNLWRRARASRARTDDGLEAGDPAAVAACGAGWVLCVTLSLVLQEGLPGRANFAKWHAVLPCVAGASLAGVVIARFALASLRMFLWGSTGAASVAALAAALPAPGGPRASLPVFAVTGLAAALTWWSRNYLRSRGTVSLVVPAFLTLALLSFESHFAKLAMLCASMAATSGILLLWGPFGSASQADGVAVLAVVAVHACAATGFAYGDETASPACWVLAGLACPVGWSVPRVLRIRSVQHVATTICMLVCTVLICAGAWALSRRASAEATGGPADDVYGVAAPCGARPDASTAPDALADSGSFGVDPHYVII